MKILKSALMGIMLLVCTTAIFAQTVPHVYVTHTEFIENESAPSASTAGNLLLFQEDGQFKYKDSEGNVYILGGGALAESKTVEFDNSMSAAEIQAVIDAQPKNLNGHSIIFQFADGTYNLSDSLKFTGFHGGMILIYGNSSDNSLSTSKSVHLDGSNISADTATVSISHCTNAYLRYLKVTANGGSTSQCINGNASMVSFYWNYFVQPSNATTAKQGVQLGTCSGQVVSCYFSGGYFANYYAWGCSISIRSCATSTNPQYALSVWGSFTATSDNSFTSNVSNINTQYGGLIN